MVVALRANYIKELQASAGDLNNGNCSVDGSEFIPDSNSPLPQGRESSRPIFTCHCRALAERKTQALKLPLKRINVYPGRNDSLVR